MEHQTTNLAAKPPHLVVAASHCTQPFSMPTLASESVQQAQHSFAPPSRAGLSGSDRDVAEWPTSEK
jgi:hypothetical protein